MVANATIFTFVMAVLKQVQNDNNRALLLSTLVMAGLVRHRVYKPMTNTAKLLRNIRHNCLAPLRPTPQ